MCLEPITTAAMGGGAGVCLLWNGKRLIRQGAEDSHKWPEASTEEIEDILHYSRLVQGAYVNTVEEVAQRVEFIDISSIVEFSSVSMGDREDAACPPHYTYVDHPRKTIVVCIRGMRLDCSTDYWTLLSNRRGNQKFSDGYVHRGILEAAKWLCDYGSATWRDLLLRYSDYSFILVGHSLGAGIASVLSLILQVCCEEILGIGKDRIQCYAFAPPRVMSLDLAVECGNFVHSIILQDDFWPRTSTSVIAKLFASALCGLQFVLFARMAKDIFISDKRRLKDTKRLYPPGTLYHIVCKKKFECAKFPYRVLKANPKGPRFEKVIITWRAMGDHHIRNYESALMEAYEESFLQESLPSTFKQEGSTVMEMEASKDTCASTSKSFKVQPLNADIDYEHGEGEGEEEDDFQRVHEIMKMEKDKERNRRGKGFLSRLRLWCLLPRDRD